MPPSWLQLYIAKSDDIWRRQLESAMDAGFKTLVVTVDAPVVGVRYRQMRARFRLDAGLELPDPRPAPRA